MTKLKLEKGDLVLIEHKVIDVFHLAIYIRESRINEHCIVCESKYGTDIWRVAYNHITLISKSAFK